MKRKEAVSKEASNPDPAGLQTVVAEALELFELARLEQLRLQKEAAEALKARQAQAAADRDEEINAARVETGLVAAQAEQQRAGELAALAGAVQQASVDLLEKAGLAHVAGAKLDGVDAAEAQPDAGLSVASATAAAFGQAQVAYAALRTALYQLATASLQLNNWDAARRQALPLLEKNQGVLFAEARALAAATYWQPGKLALKMESLDEAEVLARQALDVDPGCVEAQALREAISHERTRKKFDALLSDAEAAASNSQWNEAKKILSTASGMQKSGSWKQDAERRIKEIELIINEAQKLELRKFLQSKFAQIETALTTEQFDEAQRILEPIINNPWSDNQTRMQASQVSERIQRERSRLPLKQRCQVARQALKEERFVDSEQILRAVLNQDRNYEYAQRLLAELEETRSRLYQRCLPAAKRMFAAMPLVDIPAGRFKFGYKALLQWTDDRPTYKTDGYAIGKYPVTNAEFALFEDSTGYMRIAYRSQEWANHPVVNVTANDAKAFCIWAGQVTGWNCRLPDWVEWVQAACKSNGEKYPWGNEPPDRTRCNYGNLVGTTTPVGSYSPRGDSVFGCCDMAGNVWEIIDNTSEEILCYGGAFNSTKEELNPYYGLGITAAARSPNIGFRIVVIGV